MPWIAHHQLNHKNHLPKRRTNHEGTGENLQPGGHRRPPVPEVAGRKVFPRRGKPQQETIHHCDAAAKHYGTAAHGPCPGQYHAGYSDSL